MNKKTFLLASVGTLALVVGAVCISSNQPLTFTMTSGDPSSYSLNLSRSVTSDEISAGQASFNTTDGTAIAFGFDFASASAGSGLIDLADGGYFYNDTTIHGISAINVTLLSGTATLTYGNAKDALNLGSESLSGTSLISVSLDEISDYFKIVATSTLSIASINITYSCSNDYQYAVNRETASGDLLYSSTLVQSFSWAYSMNDRCFDVANSKSGYSFYLNASVNATGAATWYYVLEDDVTSNDFEIEIYAKVINIANLNMTFVDGSNNELLKARKSLTETNAWQKFSFSVSSSDFSAGKSCSDIKKIKFVRDLSGTSGIVKEFYLDELHLLIPETPTRNNLEMCEYTRASTTQTAAASVIFDETYGVGSTSSRKLDFASATGFGSTETGTYRAFATFNIEASLGASNGIDAKNCTLSVDLKFSSVLVNSPDTNKGAMTVDITDGNGKTASYFQVNFTMKDGWIHASRDLSGVAALSSLSGDTKTIRLGFYGVYTGNQASAVVIVDNLALTANA